MKIKKTTISVVAAGLLLSSIACAEETIEAVEPSERVSFEATSFTEAFTKGTPSGQIRLGYIWLDPDEDGANSTYDLALGGQLKFETAALYGISLGGSVLYITQYRSA